MKKCKIARTIASLSIAATMMTSLFSGVPVSATEKNAQDKLIINQVYGGGNKGNAPISHSFIEIYNPTNKDIDLLGYSIQYSSTDDTSKSKASQWELKELHGVVPAHTSFLVRGAEEDTTESSVKLSITDNMSDLDWSALVIDDSRYKVALVDDVELLDDTGDFKSKYIEDFVSVNSGDETSLTGFLTNKKSVRRKDFINTGNNAKDFEILEYTNADEDFINKYRPRSLKDGVWENEAGNKPEPEEPDTNEPDTGNPDVEKPETGGPDVDEPGTSNPDVEEPGTGKPDTDKPGTNEPDTDNPGTDEPSSGIIVSPTVNGVCKVEVQVDLEPSKENIIKIQIDSKAKEVQISFADTSSIRKAIESGAGGSLTAQLSNGVKINIPFEAIDPNMLIEGSELVLTFKVLENDLIVNKLKSVKKVYDLSLAIVTGDSSVKITNMHSGVVTVSITLTDGELKGLDRTKLAVFYYNEETKKFEIMKTKVIGNEVIFETEHFSKFVIAEKAEDGILPQTGGYSVGALLLIGVVLVLGGLISLKKHKS